MVNAQIVELLDEARISPEEFGKAIGVSGMTVRRWLKKPERVVARVYVPAICEACYVLIAEGRLRVESLAAAALLAHAPTSLYKAALRALSLHEGLNPKPMMSQDEMLVNLSYIGAQAQKQIEVDLSRSEIFSFAKLGGEWSRRIRALWQIVGSKDIDGVEKTVAYGALSYLLSPIDLIPDHIPFFGMLDDFGVLSFALAYYKNRKQPT